MSGFERTPMVKEQVAMTMNPTARRRSEDCFGAGDWKYVGSV